MPNVVTPVSNLEASVERPVILDIVRQVMELTQISSRTPIRFYGDEAKGAQKNSTIGDDGKGENRWNYDDKLVIEVDEDYERDRFLSTAVKEAENQFIFRDSKLGVAIKPVYASTEVTIHFRYRARDKNQANRWRNEIRTRCSMQRGVKVHNATYHYQIPLKLLELLYEIWRLREAQAGYGEDFNKYFAERLTTNASIVSNLNGKEQHWAVGETQGRIQGYFDFEGIPDKAEKEGEHDTYTTTFAYKFHYDKPLECNMQYPIVIHQQLLGTDYRPKEREYKLRDVHKSYTSSALAFSKFETDRQLEEVRGNDGVDLPVFDEFVPSFIVPATVRVMTALCCITEEDKKSLFNIKELGEDFALDRDVLDFILQSEYPYMGIPYHSIICLSRYEDKFLRPPHSVTIDANGDVSANADLNMRTVHRVRLSLVADLVLLTQAARDRLKLFPKAAEKILTAIDAALSDKGGAKDLPRNQIDHDDLCRLGFHRDNGNDEFTYVRSGINPQPGDYRRYVIRAGACNCGAATGIPSPIRQARCYDGYRTRFNLSQVLFVSTRNQREYQQDVNNNVFRASLTG